MKTKYLYTVQLNGEFRHCFGTPDEANFKANEILSTTIYSEVKSLKGEVLRVEELDSELTLITVYDYLLDRDVTWGIDRQLL